MWMRQRRNAKDNLNAQLALLWSNPVLRVGRLLGSLFGRKAAWLSVDGLSADSKEDYPIVPEAVATIYGESKFHIALCSRPRRI